MSLDAGQASVEGKITAIGHSLAPLHAITDPGPDFPVEL